MQDKDGVQKLILYCLFGTAFVMLVYQLWYTLFPVISPTMHRLIHLGLASVVMGLVYLTKNRRDWPLNVLIIAAMVFVTGYFLTNFNRLEASPLFPGTMPLVAGVIAVLATSILCWRAFGITFPIIAFIAIAYMWFGRYFPGRFHTTEMSLNRYLCWLGGDFASEMGLYSSLLTISANYLFLFVAFGSFLQAFGGMKFIEELGSIVSSKLSSGPAALAVLTSALLGSMTGSTVANITITGSFTIPLMKSAGYKPRQAGAIETAASNGGQILPPIMGATAFVMAGFIGIPYLSVCKAALFPALLYFGMLLMYAQLQAAKLGMRPQPGKKIPAKELLLIAPPFIVPVGVLMYFLIAGYSLMFTATWAILSCIIVGIIFGIREKTVFNREWWRKTADTLMQGVIMGSNIAIVTGVIGLVVTGVNVTGLGVNLGDILVHITGGRLPVLLFFTFVVATILGAGVPTVSAYILTAVTLSPALILLGVPEFQAHFFPMVFALFAHLTPPIGIGLIVACKMAGSEYWSTAKEALKAAFVAFLVPFIFIYAPGVILDFKHGLALGLAEIVIAIVISASIQILLQNRYMTKLSPLELILHVIIIVCSFIFIFVMEFYLFFAISIVLFMGASLISFQHHRMERYKILESAAVNMS